VWATLYRAGALRRLFTVIRGKASDDCQNICTRVPKVRLQILRQSSGLKSAFHAEAFGLMLTKLIKTPGGSLVPQNFPRTAVFEACPSVISPVQGEKHYAPTRREGEYQFLDIFINHLSNFVSYVQ